MTSNKEDYIKAIYETGGADIYVPNKVLALKLGVTPASVSEMLAKLQSDGLIEYRAYHGSRLTDKGLSSCANVVRSHELWEVFLINHLGYSWWEAHEEAHLLEHVTSQRMMERLNAFLGYPDTCPHGSPIPQNTEDFRYRDIPTRPLSDLGMNERATIARIAESRQLLDYLQRSGIQTGKEIRIVSKDEYEGPIGFEQDGKVIHITYKAASQIFVKQ